MSTTVVYPGLQEYYDTGADGQLGANGANRIAQTFTTHDAHLLTHISVKTYRVGTPGTIHLSIRATDGDGKPTGADLSTGSLNGNSITVNTVGEWYDVPMPPVSLSAGTKYALVWYADSTYAYWKRDLTSPAYSGGSQANSADSGGTWTLTTTSDFMFKEWNLPLLALTTFAPSARVATIVTVGPSSLALTTFAPSALIPIMSIIAHAQTITITGYSKSATLKGYNRALEITDVNPTVS